MVWQILTMWTIVVAAIIWFARTEQRRNAEAAMQRAAQYAAQSPRYRYQSSEPAAALAPATPAIATGGLTKPQRAFLEALAKAD